MFKFKNIILYKDSVKWYFTYYSKTHEMSISKLIKGPNSYTVNVKAINIDLDLYFVVHDHDIVLEFKKKWIKIRSKPTINIIRKQNL